MNANEYKYYLLICVYSCLSAIFLIRFPLFHIGYRAQRILSIFLIATVVPQYQIHITVCYE
jgi:hypothetical protein